jgi:hypothetical protein
MHRAVEQGELIARSEVPGAAPGPRRWIAMTCWDCRHTYEPTAGAWRQADISCPRCGGWLVSVDVTGPGDTT